MIPCIKRAYNIFHLVQVSKHEIVFIFLDLSFCVVDFITYKLMCSCKSYGDKESLSVVFLCEEVLGHFILLMLALK